MKIKPQPQPWSATHFLIKNWNFHLLRGLSTSTLARTSARPFFSWGDIRLNAWIKAYSDGFSCPEPVSWPDLQRIDHYHEKPTDWISKKGHSHGRDHQTYMPMYISSRTCILVRQPKVINHRYDKIRLHTRQGADMNDHQVQTCINTSYLGLSIVLYKYDRRYMHRHILNTPVSTSSCHIRTQLDHAGNLDKARGAHEPIF